MKQIHYFHLTEIAARKEGGEMRKRKTEMKNGVIDKDKESILFNLRIQPNYRINIFRKISVLEVTNQLNNSMQQSIS